VVIFFRELSFHNKNQKRERFLENLPLSVI